MGEPRTTLALAYVQERVETLSNTYQALLDATEPSPLLGALVISCFREKDAKKIYQSAPDSLLYCTSSLASAYRLKPKLWVLSHQERFDGTFHVELHPRGDLGFADEVCNSTSFPLGITTVCVGAALQEERKHLERVLAYCSGAPVT